MASELSLSFQDYAKEISTSRFKVTTLTAGNVVAETAKHIALQTAIIGVQLEDALQSRRVIFENVFVSRTPAALKAYKRENKWLLMAEDSVTHAMFRHEIPGADTALLVNNSEFIDLTAGDGLALKTAFDAVVISPAGNAGSLIKVQYAGKRI